MKYFGSKTRLQSSIVEVIGPNIKTASTVYEPFVGGGNATVALAPIANAAGVKYVASDVNSSMVACLSALARGWVPPQLTKDEYRSLLLAYRSRGKKFAATALEGFALSACAFRGAWATGFCGEEIMLQQIEAGKRMAPLLAGVEFKVSSYHTISPDDGDVVYCDPPYAGTSQVGGVAGFDVDAFWSWADACVDRCAKVFVSESCAPKEWTPVFESVHYNSSTDKDDSINKFRVERIYTRHKVA